MNASVTAKIVPNPHKCSVWIKKASTHRRSFHLGRYPSFANLRKKIMFELSVGSFANSLPHTP
jgi:hypothetical protein